MPRGKQSTPESTDITDTITLADDTEHKTRNASAKVTLVKPQQSDLDQDAMTEEPMDPVEAEAAKPAKKTTRPKVGRSGASRKKKSENGEQKAEMTSEEKPEKAEKKARKPKSKSEAMATVLADEAELAALQVKSQDKIDAEPKKAEAPAQQPIAVEPVPASEMMHVSELQEELAQVELSPEWEAQPSRPWSFTSILIGVLLFIGLNVAMVSLFNSHKAKNAETAPRLEMATPAQLGEDGGPAIKPAAGSASAAPAPSMTPPPPAPAAPAQPAAPVVASSAPAAAPAVPTAAPARAIAATPAAAATSASPAATAEQKAHNQLELFSILNKD